MAGLIATVASDATPCRFGVVKICDGHTHSRRYNRTILSVGARTLMARIWNLVGYICIASLIVGCGSTPQKKRDASTDGASGDTTPGGGDTAGDGAKEAGEVGEAGEATEVNADAPAADAPKAD